MPVLLQIILICQLEQGPLGLSAALVKKKKKSQLNHPITYYVPGKGTENTA